MKHYTMQLDGDSVRFTPDGKIAVVDAIKALVAEDGAERIWTTLKKERPEFADICQIYNFQKDQIECVVDGEGWDIIEDALLDYVFDHAASA